MSVQGSLGTVLSVVEGVPDTYDDEATTGFPSLTFIEVGELADIGEYGGDGEIVTHTPVKSGVVDKRLGPIDYGEASLQMARVTSDVGQTAMKSGFDGTNKGKVHSFEVVFPDGSKEFFTGIIRSFTTNVGTASNIVNAGTTVALNNRVLPVDAPA